MCMFVYLANKADSGLDFIRNDREFDVKTEHICSIIFSPQQKPRDNFIIDKGNFKKWGEMWNFKCQE